MKQYLDKLPPIFKNYYFVISALFVLWMLFFDTNDVISQIGLRKKQAELESAKEFYENKIVEVKNDREALLNNDELLEKLARERFLMKKETEDLYIIVEEE